MAKLTAIIFFVFFATPTWAQTIIATDDQNYITGEASAVLDVKSVLKGLLPPRMTNAQRIAISNPATALLIYQTDAVQGYYYYDGNQWVNLSAGSTNITTVGTITTGVWNGTAVDPEYGGTGISSYTLGDILYASGTNTLAKLPGNTTTSKRYFTQTGNGSASAAPTWSGIAAGDLPTAIDAANIADGSVSNTEFQHLSTVTSNVQTQLNTKAASGANTDITSVSLNQTGLVVKGANSNALTIKPNETLTAARTLNITTGDADRSVNLSGNLTVVSAASVSGTNTGDQTAITGNAGSATILQTARSIYGNSFNGSADLAQIIASVYGGTGNGFTKFDGPASAEKTFTLPNASATILTTNTAVTAAQGGTGQSSYTLGDVLYGSGATTLSKLPGNTSTTRQFLTQTGNGTVSAAPAWAQLTAGDIPDISGTYAPAAGSTNITTLGTVTTGSVPGALMGTRILTTTGTYTPTTGTKTIILYMLGGGGGGGGAQGNNNQVGAGGGGGSGGMLQVLITGVTGTYSYTIGTGGAAGANTGANGGAGGNTTFINGGTTYTAFGGDGGDGSTSGTAVKATIAGDGGAISTNGDVNGAGAPGAIGYRASGTVGWSGNGGSTPYGGGGNSMTTGSNGVAATGYGAGGGGGFSTNNTDRTGGAGSQGVIIIYEYR